MNCKQFHEWLDSGMKGTLGNSARTHAEMCDGCQRELDSSIALDAALADVSAPTTTDFVSSVMARVAETPQLHPSPYVLPSREWLPWWVQAAAQPTAVLAFAIISLLLWQGETLLAAANSAGSWLSHQGAVAGAYLGSLGNATHSTYVWIGLILGFSPLLLFLYLALYRGSLTLMLRLSGASPPLARH